MRILKKRRFHPSEHFILYAYFLSLILLGTVLLSLPISWVAERDYPSVALIDAFFTAVSATSVTGLITVESSSWSRVGQVIILILIQAGGLGIITFGMLYLVLPKIRMSLKNSQVFRESFVTGKRWDGRQVIRNILVTAFLIESMGAVLLAIAFARQGRTEAIFEGIFHAISAFCNAGFSLYRTGMLDFRNNGMINITLMALIISGGLGFMVISDIKHKLKDWRRPLLFHTRLMLLATPCFIIFGFIVYLLFDETQLFSSLPWGERLLASFFQSVSTRTAGFNTVDQSDLSTTSVWFTLVLMLIGGGSGSTAGGLKVSTAVILLLILFRGVNDRGDIRFLKRRISSVEVSRAAIFFLKAIALLSLSIFFLSFFERSGAGEFTTLEIVFESVSALGTVGLSMGITAALSVGGKLVIAFTMLFGRIGLFALVIRKTQFRVDALVEYPRGEVLIG